MADDGSVEEKNISRLDFDITKATQKLEEVNKRLAELSKQSDIYAQNISKNLNSAISGSNIIDTKNIKTQFTDISNISQKTQEAILKDNNKTANKIKVYQADVAAYQEKMELKKQYAVEKSNLSQLKSTQDLYDKITEYAKTYVIYQGFNALKNGISDVIDEMVELENEMVSIDRVLNESSLDLDNYRDRLLQVAYEYGNTMDNVTDITLRLAQAGFDSQESLMLTEKTLLALNTAELDATEATDDMVAIMAQWGLMTGNAAEEARNYGEIIDKVNKVADKYPTSSADILDALKKTSSAFNLAGASIDETIATITAAEVASQRGGKAIGTALSNITQQLKDEGRINIAESLGLDFYTDETKTEFKDIMDIFGELADKMQELKDAGKENSQEMQDLLSVFTVFRRNIGASLLGEMSGEDSTYLQVLNDSLTATGYSIQENEKYMQTAKAAQAQFNDTLLELKTKVWDGGVEEVYRNLLAGGTDLVKGITELIDKIGVLPTSVGAATLAFSMLNKSTQAKNWLGAIDSIKQINQLYDSTAKGISDASKFQKNYNDILKNSNSTFVEYSKTVNQGSQSLGGYVKYLTTSTAKTVLLTAKTVILQTAISAGLTLAITAIVSAIDNWIHADEKKIEQINESVEKAKENADALKEERESIEQLRKEYEELANKPERTTEENQKIYELQTQINDLIKDTGQQVELVTTRTNEQGQAVLEVNKNYDEQLNKLKAIEYQKKKDEVSELKTAAQGKVDLQTPEYDDWTDLFSLDISSLNYDITQDLKDAGVELNSIYAELQNKMQVLVDEGKDIDFSTFMNSATFEEQIKYLTQFKDALESSGKTGTESYTEINNALNSLLTKQGDAETAVQEYKDALAELYSMSGQAEDYSNFLDAISQSYDIEGPKNLIEDIQAINQEFSDGTIDIEEYFNKIQEKIDDIDFSKEGEELEAYQAIFAATTQSLAEGIENLQAGFDSNTINFADYSEGIKEAGENALELFTKQNELIQNESQQWVDANGNLNEYANNLQSARDELDAYSGILTVIGDNYDYIAQNANAAGQAAFDAADVSSQSYQNLATNLTNTFNSLRDNNQAAFNAITQNVADNLQISTNDMLDASGYLSQGFLNNYTNMNGLLNAVSNATAEATKNVTTAIGNVLNSLGDAISKFDYTISGSLAGFETKDFDVLGMKISVPVGLKFKITGEGGTSIQSLSSALKNFGNQMTNLGKLNYGYYQLQQLAPYTGSSSSRPSTSSSPSTSSRPSSSGSGGSSGGSSSSSNYDAERAAEEAAKAEQEAYDNRLQMFKDYIEEKERLEQRWVDKQKELELLSNDDYLYITEQRIKRYQQYLDKVRSLTWINAEDRAELEKEYTEQIEDLQVDYLGYLKDKLDDEIQALEDANDEKIKLIEDEADARIDALKKVEDENDRIRDKEDYEAQKKSIQEEIDYWSQRTGREAQENLLAAKKEMEELDKEWQQTQEDWAIEDQIAQIEEERDKQIAAIEEAEKKEIEAMQAAYDEKVKLFAETGQLIYENAEIQSQALYNSYKTNFIDPIGKELDELIAKMNADAKKSTTTTTPAPAPTPKPQYETYTIKYGDTLSEIAQRYGTTVQKILDANPYITNKNKIYAGKTLQIPKFHTGGEVIGDEEGFALLKPKEIILTPEWASGIKKLTKMVENNQFPSNSVVNNTIKGNLVNIEANIKNKADADYLTKKIEKVVANKLNIKK